MTTLRWFDESARVAFVGAGLSTPEALCKLVGEPVTSARTRRLIRLERFDAVWFVKTQDLRTTPLPLRKLPSYALRGSPVTREATSLQTLASLGIRTPRLIAVGEARGRLLPRTAALITRRLDDTVDLVRFLANTTDASIALATIAAAEALVERVHNAGYVLLGAKYRNILTPPTGAVSDEQLAILDQPNLKRSRSARLRAKDWSHMQLDRQRYGPAQ